MNAILVFHDLFRWLIIIFAVWTIIAAFAGMGKPFYTKGTNLSSLFFMICMDIQLVLGFILYFNNGWFDRLKHLGDNMKDSFLRFFTLEHSLLMVIAWILVHIGRIAVKNAATPRLKYKKTLIFFGIAFLIILLAIPWPFREALARPWFRWF